MCPLEITISLSRVAEIKFQRELSEACPLAHRASPESRSLMWIRSVLAGHTMNMDEKQCAAFCVLYHILKEKEKKLGKKRAPTSIGDGSMFYTYKWMKYLKALLCTGNKKKNIIIIMKDMN